MANAGRDQNSVPTLLGVSSTDGSTPIAVYADPTTHRLLVDIPGSTGTVTSVSVVSANGFAGTVATATTTPAITLTTTITGILSGNGTAISAATTTGSGSVVLATAPTFPTSVTIGVQAATTGSILFKGLTSGTVTLSTLDAAGTWTMKLPATGGTVNYFLQTDGSGTTTWAAGNAGTVTAVSIATANGFSGSSSGGATPALTIVAGAITPTSVNGLTISTTTGTFTLTNGKTFAVTAGLTLSGTDSTVMTFPTTSATIARTDAANTFTGASTTSAWVMTSPTITTKISPTSDDGAPLGDTTHNFSDLFLATGALINFANGNAVITHSSGIISVTTGELRITSANVGTNADSVPTLSSTSTLTNKTLTSPTIQTTPTLAAGTNVILTVPSADDTATGEITNAFNSGYSSSAVGDLVYLDSSSTWQKADADASAATYSGILGIALEVKASGAALKVLLRGFAYCSTAFPTFTIGSPVYMSATAGVVTQTAPVTTDSATRVLGWAVHADKMWFNPSGDYITHT